MVLYDKKDPISIETYGKNMIGHTFYELILDAFDGKIPDGLSYGSISRKGGLGNLIEEVYFGYAANSDSISDFVEAGVELKATPYEQKKNGKFRAGERLVLTMISYREPIDPNLYTSHLWEKCKLLLLVYYFRDKSLADKLKQRIDYVKLFTPPAEDLLIIEQDYQKIVEKIQAGKAHEISESDTLYLGACTKGATAEKSTVAQYYPPHVLARKRAFCYKLSYMTYVFNNYIIQDVDTFEPIIKDVDKLKEMTFEEYIMKMIDSHIGKSDEELCSYFGREYNNNKAQWVDLVYRMLGIRSNRAEEFMKANIVVKVIRLESNGKMKESMSFPPFKYKEIIKEEWDNCTLHDYFEGTKFLFVVFKSDGERYILKCCQFWNMPYMDLEEDVREGWEKVVGVIRTGVELELEKTKTGSIIVRNNLPKKSDNRIIHVRPHTSVRYYEFLDGTVIGNGQKCHSNELPDGRWMPNYSFWINNDYIMSQLDERLR